MSSAIAEPGIEAVEEGIILHYRSHSRLLYKPIGMGKSEGVALSDSAARRQMASASDVSYRVAAAADSRSQEGAGKGTGGF